MQKGDKDRHVLQFPSGFSEKFWHVVSSTVLLENVVLSPSSAYNLLALLKHGSKGQTATEIQSAFHFPEDRSLTVLCHEMQKSLKNYTTVGVEISSATALFYGHGVLSKEFARTAEKQFLADAKLINFSKLEPAASARDINHWIEVATKKKIKAVIEADDINQGTMIVLVSALYFKGQWLQKFDRSKTSMDFFYLAEGESIEVSMMRSSWECPYAELNHIDAKAIGLPYVGNRFIMVIVLPNSISGLQVIKRNTDPKLFTTIRSALTNEQQIYIQIPKFKAEMSLDLIPSLENIGIRSLFRNATLDGMFEKHEKISVSKVVQKCYLDISEEGTEAVAATGTIAYRRSIPMAVAFIVNRPFLYYIMDDHSGSILFAGLQVKF